MQARFSFEAYTIFLQSLEVKPSSRFTYSTSSIPNYRNTLVRAPYFTRKSNARLNQAIQVVLFPISEDLARGIACRQGCGLESQVVPSKR
jgi:hypothetical protein